MAATFFKSSFGILALSVLLVTAVGCERASHDIVGKWRASGEANTIVWEFSKNGSVLIGNSQGRYSFGDQNRVKIETAFATSVYQMEFAGERMTLKDPRGARLEFTRVK